jgi:hypothetical protein
MMKRRTATEHALVRDLSIYTTKGRLRTGRPDRRHRPPSAYQCSCGALLGGTSRREAKADHLDHRAHLRSRAAHQRERLAAFAEKAGAL